MRRLFAALLAAWSGACSAGKGGAPPTRTFPGAPVVLISIDTLRADHLPAYGYAGVATPAIDALRRDAILFENAYTQVPLTLPAHISLLTGRLPPEHGIRDNLGYHFEGKAPASLASVLKARGYATGAAVSAYVLRGESGIGGSFDFYQDSIERPRDSESVGRVQRPGEETARLLLSWLGGVERRPVFLFLHLYEPHTPYEPPEPFRSRYRLAYDGEIAAADAIVGGFLGELRRRGLYDRSIVLLLSDHGEGLGDHGEEEHGILLHREVLRVPLMLKLPGSKQAGTSVKAPVALIDVLPTVTALLGVEPPEGLHGTSVFDPVRRQSPRAIYGETFYPRIHLGWSDLRSLTDERYHLIDGPTPELYDVTKDPDETADLIGAQAGVARAMQSELSRYASGYAAPNKVDAHDLERLAALGYLGGTAPVGAHGTLPNPKDRIHLLAEVKAAFRLTAERKDAEAVAAFRRILLANPGFLDVQYELAQTLHRLRRYDEAEAAYKGAMRTSPSFAGTISASLARIALERGRLDEAQAAAEVALGGDAGEAHQILAAVALARDDLPRAEREAKLATGDLRTELNAAVVLAEVHIRRSQVPEALNLLDRARQRQLEARIDPVVNLEFLRGDALARLGRNAEAEAAFQEEIRVFTGNAQAYARLAIVYGLEGRTYGEVDRLLQAMAAASPGPETCLLAAKTLESMGDAKGASAWRRLAESRRRGGLRTGSSGR